eukprot:1639677-Rhodomonas_salina.9
MLQLRAEAACGWICPDVWGFGRVDSRCDGGNNSREARDSAARARGGAAKISTSHAPVPDILF